MLQNPTDVTMENNLSRVVAAISHALTISTTRSLTVSFLSCYSGWLFSFIFLKFLCVYICSFGTVTITIYLILTSKVFCCWCWHFQWLNWFMLGFDFSVWLLWSFVSSLHNPSSLHLDCGMALWVCSSSNIHASKINAYESIVFSLGYQVFQFRYLLLSSS